MGRLTLNVLLSFAQFEREVPTGERIRDKIAAFEEEGDVDGRRGPPGATGSRIGALHTVEDHAAIVRSLFCRYLEAGEAWCASNSNSTLRASRILIRIDGAWPLDRRRTAQPGACL